MSLDLKNLDRSVELAKQILSILDGESLTIAEDALHVAGRFLPIPSFSGAIPAYLANHADREVAGEESKLSTKCSCEPC